MAYSYKIPKWKVDVWKRKSKTPKSFFENIGLVCACIQTICVYACISVERKRVMPVKVSV